MKTEAEFSALIEETYRSLQIFIRYLGASESDIEDLVQDVYFKAHKALARYDSDRSFKAWLFAIAKNTFIDWTRRQKSKQKYLQQNLSEKLCEGFEQASDSKLDLKSLIEDLNEDEQILIELRFFQMLSFDEIAELIGVTHDAVKMRIFRIMTKLRTKVRREKSANEM